MNFFSSRLQTIADFFAFQEFPTNWWTGIFSWTYWTDSELLPSSPYLLFFLVVTIASIVGLVLWQKKLKRLQKEIPVYDVAISQIPSIVTLIIVMAISYMFFRSQQIAFFSSRLIILITVIIVLGWIGYLVLFLRRTVPAERQRHLENERFFRYLPKKKQ